MKPTTTARLGRFSAPPLALLAAIVLVVAGAGDDAGARPAGRRPTRRSAPASSAAPAAPAPSAPASPAADPADSAGNDAKPSAGAAAGSGATGDTLPDFGGRPAAGKPGGAVKASAPPAANGNDPAPAADPREAAPAAPAGTSPDLEKLRADYDRLRDDLFRARARAQLAEDGLYKSKLSASFRWKGAPGFLVHHAAIRLDGGEIWDSGDKPVTDDLIKVAERGVKPGPHAITLRIEIRPGKKSKDSDKLGYTSEHTFAILVPDGLRTHVAITGDEDGDAPEYEPEIEVALESEK
jgi:hypothetical protein